MQHQRTSLLLRRIGTAFVAALGVAATAFVALPANAATVNLTGSTTATCTYTNVTGTSSGDFTFTCGAGGAGSPGTISFAQSGTISVAPSGTVPLTVQRTGGTLGDVSATVNATNGCTLSASTATFLNGTAVNVPVTVTAPAASGTACVISLSGGTGTFGSPTLGSSVAINVVNPDAPVSFQFSTTTSSASFGGSAVPVVITRTGGTNGSFDVPVQIAGTMTTVPTYAGTGGSLVSGGGSLVPTIIAPLTYVTVPANTQSVTLNYTPPATAPAGVVSPASLSFAIGPAIASAGYTPPAGQTTSVGANNVHNMTVSTSTSCLTSATYTTPWVQTVLTPSNLKQGETLAVSLNTITRPLVADTGKFTVSDTTSTGSTTDVQVTVSACPGDFTSPAALNFPCMAHYTYTGGVINFRTTPWPAGTPGWQTFSTCILPTGTTTVYFNIRQVKKPISNPSVPSCGPVGYTGTCPFTVQFN